MGLDEVLMDKQTLGCPVSCSHELGETSCLVYSLRLPPLMIPSFKKHGEGGESRDKAVREVWPGPYSHLY